MKKQTGWWSLIGFLLVTGSLSAEPLQDLKARLDALRSDQPLKVSVDVKFHHKGSGLLRWNDSKMQGTALVLQGRNGVEVREKQWWGNTRKVSFGDESKSRLETETPLVDIFEARDLIDPAGMMSSLLEEATLVSDEMSVLDGNPARLLVIRPRLATANGDSKVLTLEANIWLNEAGDPIALERWMEFRLGPALRVKERQMMTFQLAGGRLLGLESRETYSGKALAILRGADAKTMKVREIL
jgi:hypothetical protein